MADILGAIAGGAVSSLLNLGGGLIQQAYSNKITQQQNQLQRKWQLEDRAHDELYNNPVAQAFRLRQAGIGSGYDGSVTAGTTQSNTPTASAPDNVMSLNSIGTAALEGYSRIRGAEINQAQLDLQRNVNDKQVELLKAQARLTSAEAENKEIENQYADRIKQAELQSVNLKNNLLEKENIGEDYANRLADLNLRLQEATFNYEVELKRLGVENVKIDIEDGKLTLNDHQFDISFMRPIRYNQAEIALSLANQQYWSNEVSYEMLKKQSAQMDIQSKIMLCTYLMALPDAKINEGVAKFLDENEDFYNGFVESFVNKLAYEHSLAPEAVHTMIDLLKSAGQIAALTTIGKGAKVSGSAGLPSSYTPKRYSPDVPQFSPYRRKVPNVDIYGR